MKRTMYLIEHWKQSGESREHGSLEGSSKKIGRDIKLSKMKCMRALRRLNRQTIHMTVDAGSAVLLKKLCQNDKIIDSSEKNLLFKTKSLTFWPSMLITKDTWKTLRTFRTELGPAGWEFKGGLLMKERRKKYLLDLDPQEQLGRSTAQQSASKELSRSDMLLSDQSEDWKENFYGLEKLFVRQRKSRSHAVKSKFNYPPSLIQEKWSEFLLTFRKKCNWKQNFSIGGHNFSNGKIKLVMVALHYVKSHELPDVVSQIETKKMDTMNIAVLVLKNAFSQKIAAETAQQSDFSVLEGNATETF